MVALRTATSPACTLPMPHPGLYVTLKLFPLSRSSREIEKEFVQGPIAAVVP